MGFRRSETFCASEISQHMNTFRPEVRLLLDCARTCLDAQRASRIKTLISKDIEWAYLLRMARGHGVMPLLYRSLNSVCSDGVPKLTLEELREHFYANAGRNLFLAKELIKLLHLFERSRNLRHSIQRPCFGRFGLREPRIPRVRRFGHLGARARVREGTASAERPGLSPHERIRLGVDLCT